MKLWSESFEDGGVIPTQYTFGAIDPASHVRLSDNMNPHLAWSEVPAGTRSLALICHDPDVPSRGDDVNQEGKTVPRELPRVDFFHWVLIDLPADVKRIAAGEFSRGVVARGKAGPQPSSHPGSGARHGINDYTGWFAGDAQMAGDYYGYDGPCPPWNDSIAHRYIFTLYALEIARMPVEEKFTGQQIREMIKGHILDQAIVMGTYTLIPAVLGSE